MYRQLTLAALVAILAATLATAPAQAYEAPLTAEDVKALVASLGPGPGCVIAPDQQERGTNALALAPPAPDFFRFGLDSFQAHLEAAKARGLNMRILRRPGLAQDLDTPEEYRRYAKEQLAQSEALV